MNILKIDLKRAILGKSMLAAIFIGLISILIGLIMEPLKSAVQLYLSDAQDLMYNAKISLIRNSFNKVTLWHFGNYFYTLVMPLICCMPFSISYIKDKQSGFSKYIIIRSSYKKYVISRIITTFVSGFLAIFITSSIWFLIITLVDSGEIFRSIFYKNVFLAELSNSNFNLFFIIYSIICSFMGGVYAIMALAVSSVVDNKLLGLVSPFILYYLGTYIISSVVSNEFSPTFVNAFYCYEGTNGIYIMIQLLTLFIVSIIVFLYKTYWSECLE